MFKLAASSILVLAVSSTATAQQQTSARRAPSAVKNAGIYHLSTGTWTRNTASTAALGPDVIYTNTSGNSGYFAVLGLQADTAQTSITDEGRLPGTTSTIAGVDRDIYEFNGVNFSYCTDVSGPNVAVTFRIFESYTPCDVISSPSGLQVLSGSGSATGLPGSAFGVPSCWVLTIDLQGSGEFSVLAEGGCGSPGHEGDIANDSFGIDWSFDGLFGTNTGMMLAGDPDWTASVPGALLHGGTGTYYSTTPSCADTGLDTQDFVAVNGPTSLPGGPGCYFFGGYKNTTGCGAVMTPFTSLSYTLFADVGDGNVPPPVTAVFCDPAAPSGASGTPVTLSAHTTSAGAGVRIEATGGPAPSVFTSNGFFLVSAGNTATIPVGQGTLCLESPLARYAPAAGGTQNSLGVFNEAGDFVNFSGTSTTCLGFDIPIQIHGTINTPITAGSTWHFQFWYRDLQISGGTGSNLSNGISVTF